MRIADFWSKWKHFSELLGNVLARILLILLYFTVFAIPGLASRLFSDKLNIKKKKNSYWYSTEGKVPKSIEDSRNQG